MKRFFNLFYTMPFKAMVITIIIVFAWLMNTEATEIIALYKNDPAAVSNVWRQGKTPEYKTSVFIEKEVERAIEGVISYSLNYKRDITLNNSTAYTLSGDGIIYIAENFIRNKLVSNIFVEMGFIDLIPCSEDNEQAVEINGSYFIQMVNTEVIKSFDIDTLNEYYKRATDEEYNAVVTHLESLENMRFALVNHDTNLIVSNIDGLDNTPSGTAVRPFFGEEKNLLIVHNSQSPYYENGTMSEYVAFVGETAKNYSDNFDLYISFGTDPVFTTGGEDFTQRHFSAYEAMLSITITSLIYLAAMFLLFFILLSTTGRHEFGGKCRPTLSDRLPNDLKLCLHLITYISLSVLYENSIYMAMKSTYIEDYWFNLSPEHFLIRSHICIAVNACLLCALFCTFKRQLSCGTLIKNTYIYRAVKNFRKAEPDKE